MPRKCPRRVCDGNSEERDRKSGAHAALQGTSCVALGRLLAVSEPSCHKKSVRESLRDNAVQLTLHRGER